MTMRLQFTASHQAGVLSEEVTTWVTSDRPGRAEPAMIQSPDGQNPDGKQTRNAKPKEKEFQ